MARILVIDNDAGFREVLRVILESNGHEILEAGNGETGINMCRENKPDLIINDLFIPEKEGLEPILEFLKSILEFKDPNPGLRTIAMSGGGDSNERMFLNYAMVFDAKAVIKKPFEASQLIALVDDQLEKGRNDVARSCFN